MEFNRKISANLVLGGGGIKGIAYVGVLETAERKGVRFANISGVSAGALVGVCIGAGYSSAELKKIMYEFNFGKLSMEKIVEKVPVVARYLEFYNKTRFEDKSINKFLSLKYDMPSKRTHNLDFDNDFKYYRGNFLENIIKYSKEGCLYDGDYLEEWIYNVLADRGIKTFADLRGGIADNVNPMGYKVRMTTVDANRRKVIVLPDDIAYYGIKPDNLEVARAVRMSTCVPFAFKPVEVNAKFGNKIKTHYFVDGGVLDNLPLWTIKSSYRRPLIGCSLNGGKHINILSTPLNILKGLITAVHDTGIPKYYCRNCYFISVDTSKISFLDFDLSDEDKQYLYNSGKRAAILILNKAIHMQNLTRLNIFGRIRYLLAAKFY